MDANIFTRRAGLLLVIFTFLCFIHGSRGEIPPQPAGGVTIVPPAKPDGAPQAYPDADTSNLPVFTMDYPRIQIPFEITLWVLLASFAKIGESVDTYSEIKAYKRALQLTRSNLISVMYFKMKNDTFN